jgi:hypothetical protein
MLGHGHARSIRKSSSPNGVHGCRADDKAQQKNVENYYDLPESDHVCLHAEKITTGTFILLIFIVVKATINGILKKSL